MMYDPVRGEESSSHAAKPVLLPSISTSASNPPSSLASLLTPATANIEHPFAGTHTPASNSRKNSSIHALLSPELPISDLPSVDDYFPQTNDATSAESTAPSSPYASSSAASRVFASPPPSVASTSAAPGRIDDAWGKPTTLHDPSIPRYSYTPPYVPSKPYTSNSQAKQTIRQQSPTQEDDDQPQELELEPSLPLQQPVKQQKRKSTIPYRPIKRVSAPKTVMVPLANHELQPNYAALHFNILRTGLPNLPSEPESETYQTEDQQAVEEPAFASTSATTIEHFDVGNSFQSKGKKRKSSISDVNGVDGPPAHKRQNKAERASPMPALDASTQQVAHHYNARPNIAIADRVNSPIIGLKNFNNWIKTVLINKFCRSPVEQAALRRSMIAQPMRGRNQRGPGAIDQMASSKLKVLDMGCGKGGDLQKWAKVGTSEYTGIDVADVSIEQAQQRLRERRQQPFKATFHVLDCYRHPIEDVVDPTTLKKRFDVVSMQFCMHYAFQDEERARMMLRNVSKHLRFGGMFIGTIPNSNLLLERLNGQDPEVSPAVFGNSRYRITFDDPPQEEYPVFGHRYSFYLQDAVDDVPEYVVQWQAFLELASEYGFDIAYHSTFSDIFTEEREVPEFADLMLKMRVINAQGESDMDEDMWDAANLYVAFAFVKSREALEELL